MKKAIQCISLFLFVVVQLMAQSDTGIPVCPLGNEWKWVPAFSDDFEGTTLNNGGILILPGWVENLLILIGTMWP